MFSKPQQTLAEEIDIYTEALKTLTQLRDKADQNFRLLKDSIYLAEVQRYHQEIKTAQLVLSKLLDKAERRASKGDTQ